MKSTILAIVMVGQFTLSPIQQCIIQWQEYEILIQYMLDEGIMDIRLLIIDEYMIESSLLLRQDFKNASIVSNRLKRGLIHFRRILNEEQERQS